MSIQILHMARNEWPYTIFLPERKKYLDLTHDEMVDLYNKLTEWIED